MRQKIELLALVPDLGLLGVLWILGSREDRSVKNFHYLIMVCLTGWANLDIAKLKKDRIFRSEI